MDSHSFTVLNTPEEQEWVNPDAPPHTYDVTEGLHWLNESLPEEEVKRIHAEAQAEIERQDPTKQNYLMRLDTKSLIKTEKEYLWCQANRISVRVIPFSYARQLLMQEDANKRKAYKEKQKRKIIRKSRKRNR